MYIFFWRKEMKSIKCFLFLSVLVLAGSHLFAGGSNAGSSTGGGGPTPIRIFMGTHGTVYKADELNMQEIMKRTNTVLDVVAIDGTDAVNLLFASGDLPDIVEFDRLGFQQYLSTGYIRPLDDLLKSHGQNILKHTSEKAWKMMTVQGKIYAYPYENNNIKQFTYVRSDWLKNLGINFSNHKDYGNFGGKYITLDEYKDILTKFTRNDPDKNGKNDTYGLGGEETKSNYGWANIFGAFGGISGQYYINNGSAAPWIVSDQYRQALQYINSLWKEGLIDPEIYLTANAQALQKMVNSVSGSGTGGWWSGANGIWRSGLVELKPEADFIPLVLTSNDGKTMGSPDNGIIGNTWTITTQSRNPEKAMAFMDFLNTDEGWHLTQMVWKELISIWLMGFPYGQK
jgi:putative aldouronate transport system substrate-binding protein